MLDSTEIAEASPDLSQKKGESDLDSFGSEESKNEPKPILPNVLEGSESRPVKKRLTDEETKRLAESIPEDWGTSLAKDVDIFPFSEGAAEESNHPVSSPGDFLVPKLSDEVNVGDFPPEVVVPPRAQSGILAIEEKPPVVEEHSAEPKPDVSVKTETKPEVSVKPETKIENVGLDLEKSRKEYIAQYIKFKNEHRLKKSKIGKIFADLGFDKQVPESEKPGELLSAEAAYNSAKSQKFESLFSKTTIRQRKIEDKSSILNLQDKFLNYEFNEQLLIASEGEFALLQKEISEGMPPLEKNIVARGLDKWGKLDRWQRISLSTLLVTGTSAVVGGAAAAGPVAFAGYRLARGVFSNLTAQAAGIGAEKVFSRVNKGGETEKSAGEEYATEINLNNFAEREKARAESIERQMDRSRRQRVYKAMTMAVAGGVASAEFGKAYEGISSLSHHYVGSNFAGGSQNPPESEALLSGKPGIAQNEIPNGALPLETPETTETLSQVTVPISSKGFIQTFHDMKVKVLDQYGSLDKVPPHVKENLFNKSNVELSKEFHFYDPTNNTSAIGLKGEALSLDPDGNIVYHHLNGRDEIMFDVKTGNAHQFSGRMMSPHNPLVSSSNISESAHTPPEVPETSVLSKINKATDVEVVTDNSMASDVVAVTENSAKTSPNNFFFQGAEVAHKHAWAGQEFLGLDDKFQNGREFANIRTAFADTLEKSLPNNLKIASAINFEGGKIHILKLASNSKEFSVLLNGKEIATGIVEKGIPKIKILNGLKGGWFLADNVYERAVKQVNNFTKTTKLNV